MTAHALAAGRERPAPRLISLFLASRRVVPALLALAGCAAGLRLALHWHWDSYGALQLPLVFETGCAVVIGVTAGSQLGEAERVTGRWLPFLRLGGAVLTTVAAGAVLAAAAGSAGNLAGGTPGMLRNLAGLTGIALLCAAAAGGPLAWTGPTGYMVAGTYALYSEWHTGPVTTPWMWPARPQGDVGAALCAGLVLVAGLTLITLRGARDGRGG